MLMRRFSEYFSMTGWRVGWMVLPPDLPRPVECLAQNLFISASYISQVAAKTTFDYQTELRPASPAIGGPATTCRRPCHRWGSPGCRRGDHLLPRSAASQSLRIFLSL